MRIVAVNNKNEAVRKNSSSGGIFYLLAEYVISEGGVVFGAGFDENFQVCHSYADNMEGVRAFMQSKYVQSHIGTAYSDAKAFLDEGRLVLFSGTPCQISALKSFLQNDYPNLITADFICHGVPSRRVWREYIDELSAGRKIKSINFRDKTQGWRVFSLKVEFEDSSVYRKNLDEDIFVKGFLQNLYLRPSCYECRHRGFDRPADVTMADFWGVQNVLPELFDDKGTSVLIIRNHVVEKILEGYSEQLIIREISEDTVRKTNSAIEHSCTAHPKREDFFGSEYKSVTKTIRRIVKDPVKIAVKKKLYKLLRG
ncbi:MAG: Coenzyme F420 hydrogenase/dehydrogenase, beta subunit C-terminal domain [Ruminococcus sp.]|nr:Coenzyme F420 hydrogenase/dehydrogenase, beta subunit C-terminal domain [Ruminococcus sp.]